MTHLAFSIDVEEWFQVGAYEHSLSRHSWAQQERRVAGQMERLLDILDQHKARATLFWLGSVAKEQAHLVRCCADAGHEIACHGWDHQRLTGLTDQAVSDDTARAKSVLEDLGGVAVTGYRAPSFSLAADRQPVYEALQRQGFVYSSSVYPVRHDHYGDIHAARQPYRACGTDIVECPLTTWLWLGRTWPVSGGGYFRLAPSWLGRRLFLAGAKQCGNGNFYMHPWEIDPDQPRVKTSALSSFRHRVNLGRMEGKVRRLLSAAPFSTVRDAVVTPFLQQVIP